MKRPQLPGLGREVLHQIVVGLDRRVRISPSYDRPQIWSIGNNVHKHVIRNDLVESWHRNLVRQARTSDNDLGDEAYYFSIRSAVSHTIG